MVRVNTCSVHVVPPGVRYRRTRTSVYLSRGYNNVGSTAKLPPTAYLLDEVSLGEKWVGHNFLDAAVVARALRGVVLEQAEEKRPRVPLKV